MLANYGFWINDSYDEFKSISTIIPKFKYLASVVNNPPNPPPSITLQLWGAVVNNRPVLAREYNPSTLNRPLTSIKVGYGSDAQSVTMANPGFNINLGAGFTNYTRFFNSILSKHNLKSRFYPAGANFTQSGNTFGNALLCNLAIVEQFSLTFVEIAQNFPPSWQDGAVNYTNTYNMSTVYHIETVQPMTLLAYAKPFVSSPVGFNDGFSIIKNGKGAVVSDAITWAQYNGITLP